MKQYRVKSLSVGGRGNKIFRTGDVVNENQFPEGVADKHVVSGHLELIGEVENAPGVAADLGENTPVQSESVVDPNAKKEGEVETGGDQNDSRGTSESTTGGQTPEKTEGGNAEGDKVVNEVGKLEEEETGGDTGIESITKAQIMKELTERGVEFDSKATKKDLYTLWLTK